MSQSIFHVRPLDTGKGWAIDEYDGRGAWQSTYRNNAKGEPLDKQEAQRRVFQLRRKAVNSAPATEPVNDVGAALAPASAPDWGRLESEVVERIRALSAATSDHLNAPSDLRDRIWNDLVVPNVRLLAEFCTNVTFDGES